MPVITLSHISSTVKKNKSKRAIKLFIQHQMWRNFSLPHLKKNISFNHQLKMRQWLLKSTLFANRGVTKETWGKHLDPCWMCSPCLGDGFALLHTIGRVRPWAGGGEGWGTGAGKWEPSVLNFIILPHSAFFGFSMPLMYCTVSSKLLAPSDKLLNYSHTSTPCCSIKIIKKHCNVLHLDSLLGEAKQMSREQDYRPETREEKIKIKSSK